MRILCIGNCEGETYPLEVGKWYEVLSQTTFANLDDDADLVKELVKNRGYLINHGGDNKRPYAVYKPHLFTRRYYDVKMFITEQENRDKKLKDILR